MQHSSACTPTQQLCLAIPPRFCVMHSKRPHSCHPAAPRTFVTCCCIMPVCACLPICLSVPVRLPACLSTCLPLPTCQVLNTEATTEALLPYIKVFQSLIRYGVRGRV